MKNTKKVPRREISYESLDQMLADADCLLAASATTTGNWSMAQIFEHLATSIEKSVDGFGFRAPWFMRVMGKLLKRRFLHHPMAAGIKLPARAAELVPIDHDVSAAHDHLHRAVRKFHAARQVRSHPVLGTLTREETEKLHLRHSELHMSFITNP